MTCSRFRTWVYWSIGLLFTFNSVNTCADWPLNVITALSQEDPMYQGLLRFKQEVEKRTNKEVNVRIFYGSQLGSDTDILEQARAGANVAVLVDAGRLSVYTNPLGILGAPFLVNGLGQARQLVTSPLFAQWEADLKHSAQLQILSFNWWQGQRHLLTQKPISVPADLNGVRLRTIGAPVFIETIRAMGATPTPMSWTEVYPALQQRVIDGAEAQHQATYNARLYEVIPHITKTAHINLMTGLVASAKWFQDLPKPYQEIVRQAALSAGDYASQLTQDSQKEYEEKMQAAGTQIHEIDVTDFKTATRSVYSLLGYEELKKQVDNILE